LVQHSRRELFFIFSVLLSSKGSRRFLPLSPPPPPPRAFCELFFQIHSSSISNLAMELQIPRFDFFPPPLKQAKVFSTSWTSLRNECSLPSSLPSSPLVSESSRDTFLAPSQWSLYRLMELARSSPQFTFTLGEILLSVTCTSTPGPSLAAHLPKDYHCPSYSASISSGVFVPTISW